MLEITVTCDRTAKKNRVIHVTFGKVNAHRILGVLCVPPFAYQAEVLREMIASIGPHLTDDERKDMMEQWELLRYIFGA